MKIARQVVAVLALAGIAGTLLGGGTFYARLTYVAIIVTIGAWVWVRVVARSITMTRRPDFWRASVGDIFKEQYEIRNSSRLPGGWVEIHNEMALPVAAGSRLLTRLNPHEKLSFVSRTWLTRRGNFPVGPTRLVIADPLGLFRVERRIPADKTLLVLPMIFPISSFLSPPGFLPGGLVIHRKSIDITPHASGVRQYVPGDPLRRIHWPTTAHRGQLIVKEFEQDPQAEVWIFLDAQKAVKAELPHRAPAIQMEGLLFSRRPKLELPPSTLEYGISIAASLAHYFLGEKRAVGLVAHDRRYTVLVADRSPRQESKILETLAFTDGVGDVSIGELASGQALQLPKGATAVLITPSTSPELALVADELQQRRLKPVVILLAAETFGSRSSNADLAAQLERQGIPTLRVSCGADLSHAMSTLHQPKGTQDAYTWQRPILSHLT
jgi:uncharacterized protein (DUF58 family)